MRQQKIMFQKKKQDKTSEELCRVKERGAEDAKPHCICKSQGNPIVGVELFLPVHVNSPTFR